MRRDLSRGRQTHEDRHGKTVLARAQRADVVAQALGQHRDHAVGKVHGAGAPPGLEVDRRAPPDVVRHVSDVDAQLVAAVFQPTARHRVVKVARVGRVHRHAEKVAQVAAPRLATQRVVDVRANGLGLLERRRREGDRKVVRGHDGLDVEVEVGARSHATAKRDHPRLATSRVGQDTRDDDVTLGDAQALGRVVLRQHEEVATDALVERHDHAQGLGHAIGAQEGRDIALHDGLDVGLRLATTHERDAHDVAIHALPKATTGDLEGPLLRVDEGMARSQHAQRALDEPAG